MILLAGINGAGKSTFYDEFLLGLKLPFINADRIALQLWPQEAELRAYEAGEAAARLRKQSLEAGQSFVTETVFSHVSKVDLMRDARRAGYRVILIYIHLDGPEMARLRVEERIARGGHSVPPEKLESRYRRLLANVQAAIQLADQALVYDNSFIDDPFRHIATIQSGMLTKHFEPVPAWLGQLLKPA